MYWATCNVDHRHAGCTLEVRVEKTTRIIAVKGKPCCFNMIISACANAPKRCTAADRDHSTGFARQRPDMIHHRLSSARHHMKPARPARSLNNRTFYTENIKSLFAGYDALCNRHELAAGCLTDRRMPEQVDTGDLKQTE